MAISSAATVSHRQPVAARFVARNHVPQSIYPAAVDVRDQTPVRVQVYRLCLAPLCRAPVGAPLLLTALGPCEPRRPQTPPPLVPPPDLSMISPSVHHQAAVRDDRGGHEGGVRCSLGMPTALVHCQPAADTMLPCAASQHHCFELIISPPWPSSSSSSSSCSCSSSWCHPQSRSRRRRYTRLA